MSKLIYRVRRLICYCMSIALAFTILASNMFFVSSLTMGNKGFMSRSYSKSSVTEVLSQQLDDKLDIIADNYGIDRETLKSSFSYDYRVSVQATAINSLYNGRYIPVSSSSNVEMRCEKAVKVHNANQENKKISEKKTAELITDVKNAFDSVYTVANAQDFASVSRFFLASTKGALLFSVASVIMGVVVYFISGRCHGSLNFIAMALESAGGMSLVLPALAITKMRFSSLVLTNIPAYNIAISSAAGKMCFIIMAVGVVMLAIGVAIFISNYKYYSVKLRRSDMEYEIEKNLV